MRRLSIKIFIADQQHKNKTALIANLQIVIPKPTHNINDQKPLPSFSNVYIWKINKLLHIKAINPAKIPANNTLMIKKIQYHKFLLLFTKGKKNSLFKIKENIPKKIMKDVSVIVIDNRPIGSLPNVVLNQILIVDKKIV